MEKGLEIMKGFMIALGRVSMSDEGTSTTSTTLYGPATLCSSLVRSDFSREPAR